MKKSPQRESMESWVFFSSGMLGITLSKPHIGEVVRQNPAGQGGPAREWVF